MELQAVVLAGGRGSRMTDLTSSRPKCLLPVGNVPLVWFPLTALQKMGFADVIVVCLESARSEIQSLPRRFPNSPLAALNLDVAALPHDAEDAAGTADAIRLVHDRLTANRIVVLSCDLVTDFPLQRVVDLHLVHRSSATALFYRQTAAAASAAPPGPKTKLKKEPRDLVGIDHLARNQICFLANEADLDESVSVRKTVLREHPRLTLHTDLVDAHAYVFDKWVCDFIKADSRFSSVKSEVFPYLVKKQFSRKSIHRPASHRFGGFQQQQQQQEEDTPNGKQVDGCGGGVGIESLLRGLEAADGEEAAAQNLSGWNENPGSLRPSYDNRRLRCYACVVDDDDNGTTCVRANAMQSYCELNRTAAAESSLMADAAGGKKVHPLSKVDPKCQLGSECFVGEGTEIADRTTVRDCVIGANCRVEAKVRLVGCVLMDGVTVRSTANLRGSYVCDGAVVGERCDVRECIVGKGQRVADGGRHANEIIASDEGGMMEI